jgi:hypothetical protein
VRDLWPSLQHIGHCVYSLFALHSIASTSFPNGLSCCGGGVPSAMRSNSTRKEGAEGGESESAYWGSGGAPSDDTPPSGAYAQRQVCSHVVRCSKTVLREFHNFIMVFIFRPLGGRGYRIPYSRGKSLRPSCIVHATMCSTVRSLLQGLRTVIRLEMCVESSSLRHFLLYHPPIPYPCTSTRK